MNNEKELELYDLENLLKEKSNKILKRNSYNEGKSYNRVSWNSFYFNVSLSLFVTMRQELQMIWQCYVKELQQKI